MARVIWLQIPRFNPRAREGRDLSAGKEVWRVDVVSIHAPARGAT